MGSNPTRLSLPKSNLISKHNKSGVNSLRFYYILGISLIFYYVSTLTNTFTRFIVKAVVCFLDDLLVLRLHLDLYSNRIYEQINN